MGGLTVDVHNRCTRVKCKCAGNKQTLTVKSGSLRGVKGFGYCTHEVVGKNQISIVTWRTVELERKGFLRPFEDSTSITVYYHSRFDGKKNLIKKPLLIRAKKLYDRIDWLESLGSYDNKRWRKLRQDEFEGLPKDDNYTKNIELENKLKALACRLFLSHAIRIDLYQKNTYLCPICTEQVNITVTNDHPPYLTGYTRYSYGGFPNNSILVHKGTQQTYRKRLVSTGLGYFLPIRVDKDDDVKEVSVYYWDKDKGCENPLLLEIVGINNISYWFENFGKPEDKYDKWKPIGYEESKDFDKDNEKLKKRLDVLNCIYNGVVQIKVGETICHQDNHYLHRNRISYGYGEEYGTYPVIYAYRYQPSRSFSKGVFDISDVTVNGTSQTFIRNPPFFSDVTKFMVYVSPCDKDKSFLISVESENRANRDKTYTWYRREYDGSDWQEYTGFGPIRSSSHVKTSLGGVLNELRGALRLQECNVITEAEGIQIDVSKTVELGSFTTYYFDFMNRKKYSIFLNKAENDPMFGFFKNTHKANTTSGAFTLDRNLQGGGNIVAKSKTENVKYVEVYFWDGKPKIPILLVVKQGHETYPKYYGKLVSRDTWGKDQVDKMDKQQALDHQNCQINNAIPIELTNPEYLQGFQSKDKPGCLGKKIVKKLNPLELPNGTSGVYIGKGYQVMDSSKISRVTYGYEPTNIIPPYEEEGPLLHLYYWKNSGIPLLVEFIEGVGNFTWFENLNRDSLNWKSISPTEAKKFYDSSDNPKLTEKFTDKLTEVNCRVNKVVQLDISQKTGRYCHNHGGRIKATKEKVSTYSGFTGYIHEPTTENGTFIISSIVYGMEKQKVNPKLFPLRDVSTVTVYFPNCNLTIPLVIHIKYGKEDIWVKRKNDDHNWEDATNEITNSRTSDKIIGILEQVKKETGACEKYQTPSIPKDSRLIPTGKNANDQELTEPGFPAGSQNDDDQKESLNEIFNGTESIESWEFFELDDEEENEEIKEEQDTHTFVSESPSFLTAQVRTHSFNSSGASGVARLQAAFNTPKVIIDIKRNPENNDTYTVNNIGDVYLDKNEDPDGSGFSRFMHISNDDIPFIVSEVKYGSEEKSEIKPNGQIENYSVWYWKETVVDMTNPLLTESQNADGTYTYYYNKSNNQWDLHSRQPQDSSTPLENEPLEKELDDLNCNLNDVVTINLTFELSSSLSETHTSGGTANEYCCTYHSGTSGKVSVTSGSVDAPGPGTTKSIPYYKHEISGGTKLAKIKYYNNSDTNAPRKKIEIPGLKHSGNGSVKVYTFYCGGNPVLIYLDYDEQNGVKGWYKKGKSDHTPWKKVLAGVSDPNNIKNCGTEFNRLVEELKGAGRCNGYQNCSDASTFLQFQPKTQMITQQDPPVTIQLSKKPTDANFTAISTTYYNGASTGKKEFTVTRYLYPPQSEFYKFVHIPKDGVSFKLEKVLDDITSPITEIKGGDKVGLVTAYYWKYNDNNPLLIEVQYGSNYSYYTNSRNNLWLVYRKDIEQTLTQDELTHKLTLLNCEINDVVQIDVTKTGDYCHVKDTFHTDNKVSVKEVDKGHLGMYIAYEHTPNATGKFNISAFIKGYRHKIELKGLQLPLGNVARFIVYFCSNRTHNPLLIYVPCASQGKQWFQKPANGNRNTWVPVHELKDKTDSDYDSIVEFLDGLQSDCKPPSVTIDIYERDHPKIFTTYESAPFTIEVTQRSGSHKKDPPLHYTRYDHRVVGREDSYFVLSGLRYKQHSNVTKGILDNTNNPMQNVTSVSVFYWTALETGKRGRPLLIKITQKEPTGETQTKETYYKNITTSPTKNTTWQEWKLFPPTKKALENKLYILNCRLNNTVIIDLSHKTGNYDACFNSNSSDGKFDEKHGESKMQVDKDKISDKLGKYEVYAHQIKNPSQSGKKFHVVSFKNGETPLTGIGSLPILDVEEVKVYFCENGGSTPLLVYYKRLVDGFTGLNAHREWYKYDNTGSVSTWKPVVNSSTSQVPSTEKDYDSILNVLNSLKSDCNPESHNSAQSGQTAAASSSAPDAQPLGAETVATGSVLWTAFGSTSGTLAGAGGLTGLGWWAFKRSKGDPWVRQI
ncbi:hypothetical protein BEWA_028420 [Theileria equi strain WA]|uniref:Uncharacterized protein n=1 Tax=Theileria equi strain WA TaxID=1537102 RepID=L0AWM7_THEEQ|nr:hypothetical protein BEWA_028420 [Theileria equi strain WA]AFZ79992.1 hypothetical protein BEWA_028420 [Theileria equi strain WA]|eukprot:XP_004829658.1 hypothetical protein BEWA_028420 [Theileria equi strain WA]